MESHSISDWVSIIKTQKSGWSQFYRAMLGHPLSDLPRFLKAVNDFGEPVMLDAVISASTKKFENSDPLAYVLAIAINKVRDEVQQIDADAKYRLRLSKMKERTRLQNEELEEKIRRAKSV